MEIGLIILSVLVVSFISFISVFTLAVNANKLNKLLFLLVSFSTGALFGDVFFHLLPEATEEVGLNLTVSLAVLFGILVSFIIEKFIHWRHCHITNQEGHAHPFA